MGRAPVLPKLTFVPVQRLLTTYSFSVRAPSNVNVYLHMVPRSEILDIPSLENEEEEEEEPCETNRNVSGYY